MTEFEDWYNSYTYASKITCEEVKKMTPTNELVLSKLSSNETIRKEFHPSELKYLIDLVEREVNRSYGVFN